MYFYEKQGDKNFGSFRTKEISGCCAAVILTAFYLFVLTKVGAVIYFQGFYSLYTGCWSVYKF